MKAIHLIICLVLVPFLLKGQGTYIENGGQLYVQPGAVWYNEGNVQLESTSTIDNSGTIVVTQDWINNAGNTGLINNSNGVVELNSSNHEIRGVNPTRFYQLSFSGGSPFVEQFVSAQVTNELDLGDAQLETNGNNMHVTNPAINSLVWNSGFVSSDSLGGHLIRSVNGTITYPFPVGNPSLMSSVYRGVEITPTTADSSTFGVRLAAKDASTDATGTSFSGATGPFDRTLRHNNIVEVNPAFYHNVIRTSGTAPANVKLFYFNSDRLASGLKLEGLAQWQGSLPRWNFVNSTHDEAIAGPADLGTPDNSVEWLTTGFDDDAFALAAVEGALVFVPQIFSPNGDGINDVIFAKGWKVQTIKYVIFNRWGQRVFETNDINIGWDGTFNGKDAQSGVFVYYVEAEIEGYGPYEQKGNITLVR